MKAIHIAGDDLIWTEVATPVPGVNQVQINIHATAINRADLMQRRGQYPPPPGASKVLGLECAGEISAVGAGVTQFTVGDRVCALLAGGGYAEYAVVDAGSVLPIPRGLSMIHGACLPEVFATAWLNLFMEAKLLPQEKVLLHAGASGVGTCAIQLCKTFGNPCFVTAGSEAKLDTCIELGADDGSNRHREAFVTRAGDFAGETGIHVILDPVGASYLQDNINLMAMNGRLVLIGLMGGNQAKINLAPMIMKRLRIIGSTLRSRTLQEKAAVMTQLKTLVWPKIEAGEIKPVLDKVFPIQAVEQAHDLVANDQTVGKTVLSLRGQVS